MLGNELHILNEDHAHSWSIGSSCGALAPSLTATAPALGGASKITAACGPTGEYGLLMLGADFALNVPYYTRKSALGCYVYINFPVLHLTTWTAPGGTVMMPIPNNSSLSGIKFALQSFWVTATTIGDSSNGVGMIFGQ